MKSGARKAALGRVENLSPPVGLALWIGLPHVVPGSAAASIFRQAHGRIFCGAS